MSGPKAGVQTCSFQNFLGLTMPRREAMRSRCAVVFRDKHMDLKSCCPKPSLTPASNAASSVGLTRLHFILLPDLKNQHSAGHVALKYVASASKSAPRGCGWFLAVHFHTLSAGFDWAAPQCSRSPRDWSALVDRLLLRFCVASFQLKVYGEQGYMPFSSDGPVEQAISSWQYI